MRMESMAGSIIPGPILTKNKIKETRATDLSENVYKGEQLSPHSQGTSFVLGASNIQKSQELDECNLQPSSRKETTDGTTNMARLEMRPNTISILGEALDRHDLSIGDKHPIPSPDQRLLDRSFHVSHLLPNRSPLLQYLSEVKCIHTSGGQS